MWVMFHYLLVHGRNLQVWSWLSSQDVLCTTSCVKGGPLGKGMLASHILRGRLSGYGIGLGFPGSAFLHHRLHTYHHRLHWSISLSEWSHQQGWQWWTHRANVSLALRCTFVKAICAMLLVDLPANPSLQQFCG